MSKIKPFLVLSSMITGVITSVICSTSCNQSTTCVIKWLNWDGTLISETKVKKGDMPKFEGKTPTRPDDKGTRYTFSGWSPEIVVASENTSYTAQYSESVATYVINFKNYDGTVLETKTYNYNDPVSYTSETPTRPDDKGTRYTFSGWSPKISAAVKDQDYVAQYDESVAVYTVTFENYDHSVLQTQQYHYNDKVVYTQNVPIKPSDNLGAYQFIGWNSNITPAYADKVYTAQFKRYSNARRVTFKNYDGTVLQDGFPAIGSIPKFTYDTIEGQQYPDNNIDVFQGWNQTVKPVEDDAVYQATFEKQEVTDTTFTVSHDGLTNTVIEFVVENNNQKWSVDWGDGNIEEMASNKHQVNHAYPIGTAKDYEVKILANKNITSITFERSYTTIQDTNERITSISLSNSIREIPRYAFDDCSGLSGTINIPNNVFVIRECAFLGCKSITSVKLPPYIKLIDRSAFQSCEGITNLDLGGTQEIGQNGFSSCALTTLNIPKALLTFNNWSFYNFKNLNKIIVDSSNPLYDSRNNCNAIIETKTNTLLKGCLGTTIPDTITTIGQAAFQFFETLESISIPNSVTRIEKSAFSYCHALNGITLPSNLTYIGEDAFYNCENISNVVIPSGVTEIGSEAFYRCSDNLVIDLTGVDHLVTGGSKMFHKTSDTILPNLQIKVPVALLTRYQGASYWSAYKSYMVGV